MRQHPTTREIVEFTSGLLDPARAKAICDHARHCHPCAVEIVLAVYAELTPPTEQELAMAEAAEQSEVAKAMIEMVRHESGELE